MSVNIKSLYSNSHYQQNRGLIPAQGSVWHRSSLGEQSATGTLPNFTQGTPKVHNSDVM